MVRPPKDVAPNEFLFREPFDQHIKEEAVDFACWIEYLLRPETHEGPRLYVCGSCHKRLEYNYKETWVGHDCGPLGGWQYRSYETFELRSVLDGIDAARFFHAVHALSNVWNNPPGHIGAAFEKLIDPFMLDPTVSRKDKGEDYPESPMESADNIRQAFAAVRSGLLDARQFDVLTYHERALAYAIGHENQMLAIAEALGRYRSIHREALNEVRVLMAKMTERFAHKIQADNASKHGPEINFAGAGIAAIVGAITTVATGPVGAAAMVGILAALGAIATDAAKGGKKSVPDGSWHDTAMGFIRETTRIGDEAYEAVTGLADRVTGQLETIRTKPIVIASGTGGDEDHRTETPRLKPPDVPVL